VRCQAAGNNHEQDGKPECQSQLQALPALVTPWCTGSTDRAGGLTPAKPVFGGGQFIREEIVEVATNHRKDWEIGRLGDWEIGRLGDWEIGRLDR